MFIIGFTEFFAFHRYITGVNNMYFPSAAIEMIGYLCMTLIASFILRWIERRMDGNDSYELVQADSLVMGEGMYEHPNRGTPFDEYSKQKGTLEEQRGKIEEQQDLIAKQNAQLLEKDADLQASQEEIRRLKALLCGMEENRKK